MTGEHPIVLADGPVRGSTQLPYMLEGRSQAFVELRLRLLGCDTGGVRSGEATVSYRLHGGVRAATLTVELPLRSC